MAYGLWFGMVWGLVLDSRLQSYRVAVSFVLLLFRFRIQGMSKFCIRCSVQVPKK